MRMSYIIKSNNRFHLHLYYQPENISVKFDISFGNPFVKSDYIKRVWFSISVKIIIVGIIFQVHNFKK